MSKTICFCLLNPQSDSIINKEKKKKQKFFNTQKNHMEMRKKKRKGEKKNFRKEGFSNVEEKNERENPREILCFTFLRKIIYM